MSIFPDFLTRLQEEDAIKSALLHYCRGVDRRDFEMVRSVYHEDAVDNHGPYNGNVDGLIEWMTKRHQGVAQSMHLIANCIIDWQDASHAVVETYCVTYQRLQKNGLADTSDVGLTVGADGQQTQVRCRYIDEFEKRDGVWKIANRVVAYDSLLLEESPGEQPFSADMQLSTRSKDDPLYKALS